VTDRARSPVTVVLVNYNTARELRTCLEALGSQTIPQRTIVVDNASTEGDLQTLARSQPSIEFVPLRRNVGFARAANIGAIRAGHNGTIVLLNPDTIPDDDFIEKITSPLDADPRIGAVAGTLVFASNPRIVASAGVDMHRNGVAIDAHLGRTRTSLARYDMAPVFGASGGAVAYRADAFFDVGGFSEPFFLYLEDVDLAWRLRLRGWETVLATQAVARHDYSASAGEGSPLKRRLLARNRLWVLARCLPDDIWTRDRRAILAFDMATVAFSTVTGDTASLRGRAAGLAGLPARLAERTRIQARTSINQDALDRWLRPAISPARLVSLRRLTARLATQDTGADD
jgi:GT2 family glycosyltransferase